ncbi:ROK family protein [Flavobacterium nitrogenifigens]|uniref:Glucokinase n=1 Tax=Flavobacterium nitrogenifigens TaxID=1617283 RepID=A0A521FA18_9FLAO|nr:ROK family protein [Flavobacterium nitrogenifigens]KAF2338009.1 ROK family protein [Flavobacterium nitrogenifigens]SMO92987.1 glucokinase [Flavobacterium nitrogenifigens]
MNTSHAIGLDIGGTHITAAVINKTEMKVLDFSLCKESFDSNMPADQVMNIWKKVISTSIENSKIKDITGIAICMPGPFDYKTGICWIKDQSKYEHFYGLNIRELLLETLGFPSDFPVLFENDAVCFGKGEVFKQQENLSKKVMAVTLGTGLGACFIDKGTSMDSGNSVPADGEIYNLPYKGGIAEDYVSARGLLSHYKSLNGRDLNNGLELYSLAKNGDQQAIQVFERMGEDLATVVIPCIKNFAADHIIIGGKIANASDLFLSSFNKIIQKSDLKVEVSISNDSEIAALLGAVSFLCD